MNRLEIVKRRDGAFSPKPLKAGSTARSIVMKKNPPNTDPAATPTRTWSGRSAGVQCGRWCGRWCETGVRFQCERCVRFQSTRGVRCQVSGVGFQSQLEYVQLREGSYVYFKCRSLSVCIHLHVIARLVSYLGPRVVAAVDAEPGHNEPKGGEGEEPRERGGERREERGEKRGGEGRKETVDT